MSYFSIVVRRLEKELESLRAELAKEREAKEAAVEEESLRWAKRLEWINNKFPVDCSGLDSGDYLDGVEYTIETAFRKLEQQKEAAEAQVVVLSEFIATECYCSQRIDEPGTEVEKCERCRILQSLPDYAAKYQALLEACELLKDIWADKPVVSTGVLHGVVDQVCEAVRQLKED